MIRRLELSCIRGVLFVIVGLSYIPSFSKKERMLLQVSATQSDRNPKMTKEPRALYPALFRRLDENPYADRAFDAQAALRHFHKRPFEDDSQLAYAAIVEAFAFQVQKIPPKCMSQISLYESMSDEQRENLDLGLIDPIVLDQFLQIRTAIVDGIVDDSIAVTLKERGIRAGMTAPILFKKPRLLGRLRTFSSDANPTAGLSRDFVSAVEKASPGTSKPLERPTGDRSVCVLKK